ncbi:hypothetical protein [Nonomuraea bangladeshensis]|uniref:hypothetical protein n=1 Tax=Nonomuraea bangladeshensis TaxID=404385 RepID=UPI0031D7FDF2
MTGALIDLLDGDAEELLSCAVVDLPDDEPCDRDTVIVLLMGCVHEHLGVTPCCQFHVGCAAEGGLLCPDCYDDHECRLEAVAEVTAEGERRVLQG